MIIEFIGSTGVGKTTLFSAVQRRLAETKVVSTPFSLVAAPLGLQGVTHPSLQNLIQELVGLPFFMRSLPRHSALVAFALKIMGRHTAFKVASVNILRSLVRKIGIYEIVRRSRRDHAVLIDEGMMLLAHNLFVYNGIPYTAGEIERFVSLIPPPDIIIYVTASEESLIRRAFTRMERRVELQSKSRTEVEAYIRRTVALYEQLINTDRIRQRVLTVENPESVEKVSANAVECITEILLTRLPSTQRVCARGYVHVNEHSNSY
jgi:thymidylate kinase